jgi:uncharacterized protein YkwD
MYRRHGSLPIVLRWLALGLFAACAAAQRPSSAAAPAPEFRELERQVARLVNEHRAARRLRRLTYDTLVAAIARLHSADMASGRVSLGHEGFDLRADAVEQVEQFSEIAENVAMNDYARERTVGIALQGWLASAHHLASIEGPYNATGVGVARGRDGTFFYTQIFVARR